MGRAQRRLASERGPAPLEQPRGRMHPPGSPSAPTRGTSATRTPRHALPFPPARPRAVPESGPVRHPPAAPGPGRQLGLPGLSFSSPGPPRHTHVPCPPARQGPPTALPGGGCRSPSAIFSVGNGRASSPLPLPAHPLLSRAPPSLQKSNERWPAMTGSRELQSLACGRQPCRRRALREHAHQLPSRGGRAGRGGGHFNAGLRGACALTAAAPQPTAETTAIFVRGVRSLIMRFSFR